MQSFIGRHRDAMTDPVLCCRPTDSSMIQYQYDTFNKIKQLELRYIHLRMSFGPRRTPRRRCNHESWRPPGSNRLGLRDSLLLRGRPFRGSGLHVRSYRVRWRLRPSLTEIVVILVDLRRLDLSSRDLVFRCRVLRLSLDRTPDRTGQPLRRAVCIQRQTLIGIGMEEASEAGFSYQGRPV